MHPHSKPQPILNSNLTFTEKEMGRYVLEVEEKYFDIDVEAKLVLQILSKSNRYSDATIKYIKATGENFTEEEFTFYASELLKKFNLDKKNKSFLLVERVILSPKIAGKLAFFIKWLFQPILFWFFFIGLFAFSLYLTFFLKNATPSDALEIRVIPFFLFYFITILFHELGHIAACNRFTGKNGGMGIGVYIIYPVFYSDISSIWHATKQEKIIANLAGIYMQLWFVPMFFLYGIWSGDHFFQDFSKLLVFICFIQILPFIRSDGYWLLSDLFNVPNLLQKSQENIRKFIKNPIRFFQSNFKKEIATLSYGLINTTFILFFAYFQVRYNFHALLDFPLYFWSLLKQIFIGNISNIEFESQYVMVIVFYYLIFTYGKIILQHNFKN